MVGGGITAEIVSDGLGAFDGLEELGAGTFGTTFRAVRGDEVFALKVIHHPNMPDYLWEREINSLAAVDHPNVMGLYESGSFVADGRDYPYLRCEYIDGGSIEANIAAGRRPSDSDSLRALTTGLLAGVCEIHDLGIFHRDIKPGNVALRGRDWGQPVLLDFGLAKVLDMSSHTVLGQARGTTAYMAPEQLRGEPARSRSDLFAVGLVVYEAGTGHHPFIGDGVASVQTLHDRIADGPPADPRETGNAWDDDIAEVVLRLLRYEPHERFSVTKALRELEAS